MQVKFDWVRDTKDSKVYIAHLPGVKRGVTFPIPKVLGVREETFYVEFPSVLTVAQVLRRERQL